MAVTTKQAAIDNLQAIAQLITQSPEGQIQEIVNKIGDQLQQMLQVDAQQSSDINDINQTIAQVQVQLTELPQLGEAETERVLELIAENMPEVAQLTLPKVVYRGQEYSLKEFSDLVALQQGKKPTDYSEATYTPEGYLSSVLVKYDDGSQQTVTLSHVENDDGTKAIYIGRIPNAGGAVDAFEWHVGITRINSPILNLSVARHTDVQAMRLIGSSHLITWGNGTPSTPEADPGDSGNADPGDTSGEADPGDSGNADPGDTSGEADPGDPGDSPGIQDVPLPRLDGGYLKSSVSMTDALGGGFINATVTNQGLYRIIIGNAVPGYSYAVSAGGNELGTMTADSNGGIIGAVALQAGDVLSITADASGTPFSANIQELDQNSGGTAP